MTTGLLGIATSFGVGAASGLNASLPLLAVGVLARLGLIQLNPPFDALASDVALCGLVVVATLEFLSDKIDVADSALHALMLPAAVVSGAILAGARSGAIRSVDPGLMVLASFLAGGAAAGATTSRGRASGRRSSCCSSRLRPSRC